ncbi:MAG TPA: protein phosphatase 2C domain-containing protein [Sphingopyxis sp.]|nr:protein phosphatase 2C domain-containing protein [Sphingopyxis sp.]HMP44754.1 protein phosphatase 2C domain-containing protein [Sphingopyxis sp.]HMQ19657.1 protein phosphatase 2C domain-containing protein [Sphingopyxis sp.]
MSEGDHPVQNAFAMPAGLGVRSAGISDIGLKRGANEDALLMRDEAGLWLVADGMGGHEHGAFASGVAVSGLRNIALPGDFDGAVGQIAERFHAINGHIWQAGDPASDRPSGTTAVALVVRGHRFAILWVGDSRAYIYRSGGLFQLSTDHTMVQDLVDQGMLTEEQARSHPMSHVLSRALGVTEAVQVDIVQDQLEPGDRFLLCSDGLTGPVGTGPIRETLALADPQACAEALIAAAHAAGAPDNVTVAVIDIVAEEP